MLQIQITGFLDKDTANFCKELWLLCLSAQSNPQGVPKELLEAKKNELIQAKVIDIFLSKGILLLIPRRSMRKRQLKTQRSRRSRSASARTTCLAFVSGSVKTEWVEVVAEVVVTDMIILDAMQEVLGRHHQGAVVHGTEMTIGPLQDEM